MKVSYFSWIRDRVGISEEVIALPDEVTTVAQAISYLTTRGDNYRYAFEKIELVRVAINLEHGSMESNLTDADELALFPPMTGG